jgi:hypothetical protein
VHLVFDIFQGIGIACALGIRPFLPGVAVGALAIGDVEIHFDHSKFSFLQGAPFLLVLAVVAVVSLVLEAGPMARAEASKVGTFALVLSICGFALGAVFFAGALCRGGYAFWPGIIGGVVCARIAAMATGPFLARLRTRLDADAAAVGVPLIAEGSAVLLAVASVVAPPVGVIALLGLLWLIYRGRGRDEQKYAGLRILR